MIIISHTPYIIGLMCKKFHTIIWHLAFRVILCKYSGVEVNFKVVTRKSKQINIFWNWIPCLTIRLFGSEYFKNCSAVTISVYKMTLLWNDSHISYLCLLLDTTMNALKVIYVEYIVYWVWYRKCLFIRCVNDKMTWM